MVAPARPPTRPAAVFGLLTTLANGFPFMPWSSDLSCLSPKVFQRDEGDHRPGRTRKTPHGKVSEPRYSAGSWGYINPTAYEGPCLPGGGDAPSHSPKRSRRLRKGMLLLVPAKVGSAIFRVKLRTTGGSWAAGRRRRFCRGLRRGWDPGGRGWDPGGRGWDPGGRGRAGLESAPLFPLTFNKGSISSHAMSLH